MMPGVRRDEQDRRGQQADVELADALERPEVEVLDDPEHRVAGEAALRPRPTPSSVW